MSSTTYVRLEKTGPKYDGNFAHIKSFNRKFEARLKAKNPLAAYKEIKSEISQS